MVLIRELKETDRIWIEKMVNRWGAEFIVSRGRKIYPVDLDGFIAEEDSQTRVGLLSYEVRNDECEIVLFEVLKKHRGIGSRLLDRMIRLAEEKKYRRVWLVTTNDNLDALRFYQRKGFFLRTIHRNAIQKSRELKPSIPMEGKYNIPIRDELELDNIEGPY